MTRGFDRQEVLKAIDGCGGIVMVVASRLGCAWHTAESYIQKWESTKLVFEDEDKETIERAASLIKRNIDLGLKKQQEDGVIVDSGDARWLLSRKGKDMGWAERTEVKHEGTGEGGEVVIQISGIDLERDI